MLFYVVAMYIGDSEFKGQAPGPFIGLDLNDELYIGAIPDFRRISRAAGYSNGFTGESLRCWWCWRPTWGRIAAVQ